MDKKSAKTVILLGMFECIVSLISVCSRVAADPQNLNFWAVFSIIFGVIGMAVMIAFAVKLKK